MRVGAPGKLLLTGAYAVLEGAPALVVAVDRLAVADGGVVSSRPTPEVLAALRPEEAPEVDASQLRRGEYKLGLGSSAAILVASLGVALAREAKALDERSVRDALLERARVAHASAQGGGSGLDVAASVYGGVLEYRLGADGAASVRAATLPSSLVLDVFWCGSPAVTTGMRKRVDALRVRDPAAHEALLGAIAAASRAALAAGRADDLQAFLASTRATGAALNALGRASDTPIFPEQTLLLAAIAERDGGAFVPSGAGGGDVFVYVGQRPASAEFRAAAAQAGVEPVPMSIDRHGVRPLG